MALLWFYVVHLDKTTTVHCNTSRNYDRSETRAVNRHICSQICHQSTSDMSPLMVGKRQKRPLQNRRPEWVSEYNSRPWCIYALGSRDQNRPNQKFNRKNLPLTSTKGVRLECGYADRWRRPKWWGPADDSSAVGQLEIAEVYSWWWK